MNLSLERKKILLNWLMMIVGIFIMGTGAALMVKSETGVAPMNSLPTVMTQVYPVITLGTYTFLLNFLFFALQFVIEPKSFNAKKLLQLVATFVLSISIDINVLIFKYLEVPNYTTKILLLFTACVLFSISIAFMITARVALMPGEAFIMSISGKIKKEYESMKVYVELLLVVITVIISLVFVGKIHAVREGTLIAAIAVGNFTRYFRKYTDKFKILLEDRLERNLNKEQEVVE